MEPQIQSPRFGSITVDGETLDHDIVFRLGGEVKKRKKKLSKQHYGTSHTVSLDEAKHIYNDGAERLIVGTGQHDSVRLSEEAEGYFQKKGCSVDLHSTPDAIQVWNEAEGKAIGMFHVTCSHGLQRLSATSLRTSCPPSHRSRSCYPCPILSAGLLGVFCSH